MNRKPAHDTFLLSGLCRVCEDSDTDISMSGSGSGSGSGISTRGVQRISDCSIGSWIAQWQMLAVREPLFTQVWLVAVDC